MILPARHNLFFLFMELLQVAFVNLINFSLYSSKGWPET